MKKYLLTHCEKKQTINVRVDGATFTKQISSAEECARISDAVKKFGAGVAALSGLPNNEKETARQILRFLGC